MGNLVNDGEMELTVQNNTEEKVADPHLKPVSSKWLEQFKKFVYTTNWDAVLNLNNLEVGDINHLSTKSTMTATLFVKIDRCYAWFQSEYKCRFAYW